MAWEGLKYAVFLFLVAILFTALLVFLANLTVLMQNIVWLTLLALFIAMVWKYDFILMLKDYERAVIMRFGKINRVGGPGWCIVLPIIESATIVDLRTQTVDVPKQDVITRENIELRIDTVIYMRVKKDRESVINSVVEVENYKEAIRLYIISAIRDVIGSMELPEVIANTEALGNRLKKEAEKISSNWGIEIVSVEIKDVDIPQTVLEAMHEEKAAVQRKLARMQGAEAHMAEIRAVREAAEKLSDRALAYYYIRALEKLGAGKSTKFIFPMELSKLAEALGSRVSGRSSTEIEELFRRYAPAVERALRVSEGGARKGRKRKGRA